MSENVPSNGREGLREALQDLVDALDWYAGKYGLGPVKMQYALQKGREALAAAPAPAIVQPEVKVPSLWKIDRCQKHDDWVSNCIRCQEEVLTTKTENAYRAGFADALRALADETPGPNSR